MSYTYQNNNSNTVETMYNEIARSFERPPRLEREKGLLLINYINQGMTANKIRRTLGVTSKTVDTYKRQYNKLFNSNETQENHYDHNNNSINRNKKCNNVDTAVDYTITTLSQFNNIKHLSLNNIDEFIKIINDKDYKLPLNVTLKLLNELLDTESYLSAFVSKFSKK